MLDRQYYSTKEVARRLGKSPRTVRDWIANGCPTPRGRVVLPAIQAGKSLLIDRDELDVFEVRIRRAGGRQDLYLP